MESMVLALVMLSLSPLSLTRDVTPRTVTDTQQLQEALAQARPGETIRIAPGDYRGGLTRAGAPRRTGQAHHLEGGPTRNALLSSGVGPPGSTSRKSLTSSCMT